LIDVDESDDDAIVNLGNANLSNAQAGGGWRWRKNRRVENLNFGSSSPLLFCQLLQRPSPPFPPLSPLLALGMLRDSPKAAGVSRASLNEDDNVTDSLLVSKPSTHDLDVVVGDTLQVRKPSMMDVTNEAPALLPDPSPRMSNRGNNRSSQTYLVDPEIATVVHEPASFEVLMDPETVVPEDTPFGEALKAQSHLHAQHVPGRHYIPRSRPGEITREHEQYNLTYAMMIGIRHSVTTWQTGTTEGSGRKSNYQTLKDVNVRDMKEGVLPEHFERSYKLFFPPQARFLFFGPFFYPKQCRICSLLLTKHAHTTNKTSITGWHNRYRAAKDPSAQAQIRL